MTKDKNIKKRQKREQKKKRHQGQDSLNKGFSPEEKNAGKMHIYVLLGFTVLVSAFIIYSYSK